jgi:CBS domain-containing protein
VKELFEGILLEAMMIENWVRKRLVLVGHNQPLDKALARLNRHKISSVPVINEDTGAIKGILDSLDVVNYLSQVLEQDPIQAARWDFNLRAVSDLLENSKKKTMVMSNSSSMYEALQELSKGRSPPHRVMVVDQQCQPHLQSQEEPFILGVFSQTDILRFLGENPYWMNISAKSHKTLKELLNNQYFEKVVTIEQTVPAYLGFRKISESDTSGVAVIDGDGRIVANLSASNIRGISRRNFHLMNRPLFEFLQRDRRRGWWTMPITIRENDTLEKAVLQFCASRVHQMYVVDDNGKPTAVITPTDLITHFVESYTSTEIGENK